MTWATKYIGLPFAEGGRGPDRFDCWGLCAAVLRQERGIEVEPFAEVKTFDMPAIEETVRAQLARNDWLPVDLARARPFDVAVMWVNLTKSRTLSHIGIVERPGRLLHIEKEKRAICARFSRLAPFQIEGIYRHRRLA